MHLTPDEIRQLLYCVSEVHRGRVSNAAPGGVSPWLIRLLRRLELEYAVSRSGHDFDCESEESDAWISVREAASHLGLSKRQTTRLAADLNGRIVDGRWIFPQANVIDYSKGRRDGRRTA